MTQAAGFCLPRLLGLDRGEAKPPLRSSEPVPSKTAWPAVSCRILLREMPPITRSSMTTQSAVGSGLLKSKSSRLSSGGFTR